MISQDNFIALLASLGFAKNKSIYSKTIGATSLSVDVNKQTIHYPESDGLVVNERQTCNFSANENFVVFECVHRLLEKGYKPEHIELEPKWKLGRGASGGRADILVKAYSLTDTINDAETANSIETFFVERAKQLLKSGGVAAIILPSSILSNGGSTYIRAREILLQYFDIVTIAEFGSGTFGKTGTNTVTLFLRRKPTQPDTAEHYRERVEEWFKGCVTNKRKQAI